MASAYPAGSGTYETSLPDPPAKRIAPPLSEAHLGRPQGDVSTASVHHYAAPLPNTLPRDASHTNTSTPAFAMPQRHGSREIAPTAEQVTYSYAAAVGSSATSSNSPFSILQHPIFVDATSRDSMSTKTEDANNQRYQNNVSYMPSSSNLSSEPNERTLGAGELLPPSAYTTEGVSMATQHAQFTPLPPVPGTSNHFNVYGVPAQYSQFHANVYGAGGSGAPSSPPPPALGAHPFSMPMLRPEFAAPNRAVNMQRRHSIAVPSPGHHYGLWPPPAVADASEWHGRGCDETDSNLGADDGSDSDGGEGTSMMVSLRPKDMPPGGPIIEGRYITLLVGPGEHQVKDFNILPINILRINYESKSSDYIVVHLLCDAKMKRATRDIFMTAVSAHHLMHDNKRAVLPALKISQQMLRGRTKGFLFQLRYTLVVDGRELESLLSEPFYLWSNVSQRSFPRHEREAYAMETQDINTRKRRRR